MLRGICGDVCSGDVSWTWRKILILRSLAVQFIKHRVGNGGDVFICHDDWHHLGPLKLRFGPIVIYDAASNDSAKMAEYASEAGCNMPLALSNDLIHINTRMPA